MLRVQTVIKGLRIRLKYHLFDPFTTPASHLVRVLPDLCPLQSCPMMASEM